MYIQFDLQAEKAARALGYSTARNIRRWYKEYLATGELHKTAIKKKKYSEQQKEAAINYYLTHGKNIAKTVKRLGYPNRCTLTEWLDEAFPERRNHCVSGGAMIECSQEMKKQAVVDLCVRKESAKEVANAHGVSRGALYKWKSILLSEDRCPMAKKENLRHTDITNLEKKVDALRAEEAALTEKVHRARLEYDILEKAAELLKKDLGINLETLNNREKAILIDALRNQYRLKDLLLTLCVPKSSYCYQVNSLDNADKYAQLRIKIREVFTESKGRYGYRRVYTGLRNEGIIVSEKIVRRIMGDEKMIVRGKKSKKYNSYVGEVTPAVPNIINRDFHAKEPNVKWLTDITEFALPAGKVYLSPIIDCFDGLPVSWTIGTSPSAELANTMLDRAVSVLKEGEHPIIHSDRGGHYRWPGWLERTEKAHLTRSMSKKGCSPDNAACEGFFGRLKNEMFYGISWQDVSVNEFIAILDEYMYWYRDKRIKLSLGGMSPLQYRHNLGLIVPCAKPTAISVA